MTSEAFTSTPYARKLFTDLASMLKHFHQEENVKQDTQSASGDELKEAGEYHQLAKLLARCRQNKAASVAQALARELLAKQLNDMDGFDR
jgi:hypothetical protein